ncbi:flavodoxin family protein [Candidatus Nitrosocosmicus hydrocola]|uniref:flavodoxin family protein n=1 Tax=Candidatus Nitrosocosmicus hydrocola TaxID=1826872 RepID=UPI0018C87D5E|nr:NAD(P)H-dependent oxidoreductase [Candidatus Nitrosocosmicus hydrocola]
MSKIKAVILLGSLKTGSEDSNTLLLSQFLVKQFSSFESECEIIKLADYDIKPGTYTIIDSGDDWPSILGKMLAADIVIFATPVWWGIQSSLIQRTIERLDELHDEIMDSGRSRLTNKVSGIIVTGDSDGAEHIIGNLTNFFVALGLTIPPFGTLTVLWPGFAKKSDKSEYEKLKYLEDNYASTAKKAAENLVFMANLLKKNPYPE